MNLLKQHHEKVFLFTALLLFPFFLFNAPGTHDVWMWIGWGASIAKYGLIEGYASSSTFYPPLMFVNLGAITQLNEFSSIPGFYIFKISLLICIAITCWQVWRWTQNKIMVLALYLSLVFSCIYMAYMDAWIAPLLIGALYALVKRRYVTFSILYCIGCLIKWQPIILAPVIGLYILDIGLENRFDKKAWCQMLLRCLGPAILICGLLLSIFDFGVVIRKLLEALNDGFLSAWALNLAWIMTYGLHIYMPEIYGPLQHNEKDMIMNSPVFAVVFLKVLFAVVFLITLATFFKKKKSITTFLGALLSVYFAYYILNSGVHENHLFIGVLLVSIMAGIDEKYLPTAIIISLMHIINMLMFYNFYKDDAHLGFLIMNMDISLIVSIFNVAFFFYFWINEQLDSH